MSIFKEKLENIQRYNSLQEKDALLLSLDSEKIDIIKIAKSLGLDPLNKIEAEALILKAREISVSESIEITSKCPNCNYINISSILISDMFFNETLDNSLPVGLFEDLSEISDRFLDSDDISLEEYNDLENLLLDNNIKIFNKISDITCLSCKKVYQTKINPIKSISKFSINNIYEQYLDISYFSNMTKDDVDKMYPFEREIFLGLIQKKEDEDNNINT